jgi:hypothetical protein
MSLARHARGAADIGVASRATQSLARVALTLQWENKIVVIVNFSASS